MRYETTLACLLHTRDDDATDIIRILCALATAAHLLGDTARRDRTIEVPADIASDAAMTRRHRPE